MAKSSKKLKSKTKGVLYYICPVCGLKMRYKAGRKKHPRVKSVDLWLDRAQCPKCGKFLRIKDPEELLK